MMTTITTTTIIITTATITITTTTTTTHRGRCADGLGEGLRDFSGLRSLCDGVGDVWAGDNW